MEFILPVRDAPLHVLAEKSNELPGSRQSNMNYVSVTLVYVMHGLLRIVLRAVFTSEVNVSSLSQFKRGVF